MSEWRDIASAPKDGTRILAALASRDDDLSDDDFFGDGKVCVVSWDSHYEHGDGWLIDYEEQFAGWCNPTHWQPLPDPPSIARDRRTR